MKRVIAIAVCLLCYSAYAADQVIGVERTTARVGSGSTRIEYMDRSLYDSCTLWISRGRDSGTNYYSMDKLGPNNGTATNAATTPAWTSTNIAATGCLKFDGSNDRILVPSSVSITNSSAFAFAAVIYNTGFSTDANAIGAKRTGNSAGKDSWWFGVGTGIQSRCAIFDADRQFIFSRAPSMSNISNRWQFVAFSYNGTTATNAISMYGDNGAKVDTLYGPGTGFDGIVRNTTAMSIGGIANPDATLAHTGYIGDVMMFNRAITADEVLLLIGTMERLYGDL